MSTSAMRGSARCSPASRSRWRSAASPYTSANFPTYTLVYGAFATLPIFLLWMYLSWLVVLAGAVFTAMLPGYRVIAAERKRPPGRDLTEALDVLAVLARAQDGG